MAKVLYRFFRAESVADNARAFRVAFSSETPVLRMGDGFDAPLGQEYYEVLDHNPDNQDLSLLQNRGAVLDEHDPKSPIGYVLSAEISTDKMGRAQIEMDDGEGSLGLERSRQMKSGMRPHISFGYDQTRMLSETKGDDGKPVKRFAWRAHEISSVAIPADPVVGVGRNFNPQVQIDFTKLSADEIAKNLTPENKQRMRILLDATSAGGGGTITVEQQTAAVAEAQKKARSNERERIAGCRAIADAFKRDFPHPEAVKKIDELCAAAEAGEESAGEFSVRVLTKEAKNFQRASIKVIADEDLHDDISQYSFSRALRTSVEQDKIGASPTGLEGEVHKELVKRCRGDFSPQGFLTPYNRKMRVGNNPKLRRLARAAGDLQVGVFGQGGAVVPTDLYMPLIGLLRNLMVTDRLGMQTISGIEGMISWPRHVAACTPFFVPETFLLNVSTPLLDQLAASPHRVGVTGAYSKQLILQSALDVENWLRDDQMKSHAVLIDQVSLLGTGANNQPVGVFNTPGIGAVNFNGPVTYQKVVNFKTQLALGNAAVADMAFVTTPLVEEKWRTTPKIGNQFPIFIWEDGAWGDETADGRVIGLRATATNQVTNDRVGFGNFNDAKKLFWGGLDIVVNPYSRSKEAVVEVTTNSWMDVMVDHQQSFAYSVDAGDQ